MGVLVDARDTVWAALCCAAELAALLEAVRLHAVALRLQKCTEQWRYGGEGRRIAKWAQMMHSEQDRRAPECCAAIGLSGQTRTAWKLTCGKTESSGVTSSGLVLVCDGHCEKHLRHAGPLKTPSGQVVVSVTPHVDDAAMGFSSATSPNGPAGNRARSLLAPCPHASATRSHPTSRSAAQLSNSAIAQGKAEYGSPPAATRENNGSDTVFPARSVTAGPRHEAVGCAT